MNDSSECYEKHPQFIKRVGFGVICTKCRKSLLGEEEERAITNSMKRYVFDRGLKDEKV